MSGARWTRGLLVVALCALVEYGLCRLAVTLLRPASESLRNAGPADLFAAADIVTGAAAVCLALAWSWLSCGAMLMVAGALRGGVPGRRLAVPRRWHRAVGSLLGVGALCLPVSAGATASDNDAYGSRPRPAATALDGLPLPDRPRGTGQRPRAYPIGYQVVEGDSLWGLTRRHLGPAASDARVARTWPLWYATNEAVIGSDPDLLIPGTVLQPPPDAATGPGCSVARRPPAGDDPASPHGGRP